MVKDWCGRQVFHYLGQEHIDRYLQLLEKGRGDDLHDLAGHGVCFRSDHRDHFGSDRDLEADNDQCRVENLTGLVAVEDGPLLLSISDSIPVNLILIVA